MKGKFIVIEGIDGCGKTTQIDELSKWIPNSGLMNKCSKLITTREPGGSLLGKKLRGLILDNTENNKPSSLAELLLRIRPLSFFPKRLPPGSLVVINLDSVFKRPLFGSHLDSSFIWVLLPHPSIPSITINFPFI